MNYTEELRSDFIGLFTDPAVMRQVDNGVYSGRQAEALWKKILEGYYREGVLTIWAVLSKNENKYLGHALILPRVQNKDEWEFGIMLRSSKWGKGLGRELAGRLVRFAFENMDLPVITATVDDDNQPAVRVLEKTGLVFSEFEFDRDGRYSVYSLRRSDTG